MLTSRSRSTATNLSDTPAIQGYVDGALREGVELELEDQVLTGDGLGGNIEGIANTSGISAVLFDTDAISTARLAIAELETDHIDPGPGVAFVMSVNDWAAIELDTDANDRFRLDGQRLPVDTARRRLWGVPVLPTTAQADGDAWLVDFRGSTQGLERESVRIDFTQDLYDPNQFGVGDGGSIFESNQIMFRGEGRFDFAVTRPRGVVAWETVV